MRIKIIKEDGTVSFEDIADEVSTENGVTLEQAKAAKTAEINAADEASNKFYVLNHGMWLDKDTRSSLASNTIPALESEGVKTTMLWSNTTPPVGFEVTIEALKTMLVQLELYCKKTYDITHKHIAAVYALTTVAEVEAFDASADYPDKLSFTL